MGCNRRIVGSRRTGTGLWRRAKKKNSRQPETGGKNRENEGMHATKMAAHCVHSIARKRDRKHETGMEAVVEWG